jgi:hypothetical protein
MNDKSRLNPQFLNAGGFDAVPGPNYPAPVALTVMSIELKLLVIAMGLVALVIQDDRRLGRKSRRRAWLPEYLARL